MPTITKRDLIERIAKQTGQRRVHVKATVHEFLNLIVEELADGNRLEFRDFGVFEVKERAARMAQNPRTLERVPVPAKKSVKFKVGRLMRERVEDGALDAESSTAPAGEGASNTGAIEGTSPDPLDAPVADVHVKANLDASIANTQH